MVSAFSGFVNNSGEKNRARLIEMWNKEGGKN